MKALKILCACLLALPLLACATVTPTQTAVAVGDVGGRMGAMLNNLKEARPHADAYGQGHIDSAITNGTQIQQKDLPILEQAAAKLAAAEAKIKQLYADFWSPRQHALFRTVVISIICIIVLMGVLKAFEEEPIVGGVLKILTALCTGGLSVVRDIIAWIIGKGVQAAGAISIMHTAAQTLHAVAQDTKLAQNGIVTGGPVVGVAVSVPSAGPGTKEQPIAQ